MGKLMSLLAIALTVVGVGLILLRLMGLVYCSRLTIMSIFLLALLVYVALLIAAVVFGVEI